MNTIQYGLRNYRNHENAIKPSLHPLDITDNRRNEESNQNSEKASKKNREEFSEILKKEMSKYSRHSTDEQTRR